jgi:putative addiction module killer protein
LGTLATRSGSAKVFRELRIDYGPGYRVYFVRRGETVIVLLAGGNKRTQTRDIEAALRLARFL